MNECEPMMIQLTIGRVGTTECNELSRNDDVQVTIFNPFVELGKQSINIY